MILGMSLLVHDMPDFQDDPAEAGLLPGARRSPLSTHLQMQKAGRSGPYTEDERQRLYGDPGTSKDRAWPFR
jgi:hypothetical protein